MCNLVISGDVKHFPRSGFQHEGKWCENQLLEPNAWFVGEGISAWCLDSSAPQKNTATSDHQRSSCIISAVNRLEQEQLRRWASRTGSRRWPMNKKEKKWKNKYYYMHSYYRSDNHNVCVFKTPLQIRRTTTSTCMKDCFDRTPFLKVWTFWATLIFGQTFFAPPHHHLQHFNESKIMLWP